jgi:hypothetical protein
MGVVCASCNNRFGLIENRILSSEPFINERKRLGLLKEGHPEVPIETKDDDLRRFVLKMGYEALWKSRRCVWNKLDHRSILDYLLAGIALQNVSTKKPDKLRFQSIPGWVNKYRLQNNRIYLEYSMANEAVFVRFQFGRLTCSTSLPTH